MPSKPLHLHKHSPEPLEESLRCYTIRSHLSQHPQSRPAATGHAYLIIRHEERAYGAVGLCLGSVGVVIPLSGKTGLPVVPEVDQWPGPGLRLLVCQFCSGRSQSIIGGGVTPISMASFISVPAKPASLIELQVKLPVKLLIITC